MITTRLAKHIDIKHGYAFPGEGITEVDNGTVLVTPGNFAIGGGFQEDKCKFFEGDYPEEYLLNEADLVVTMTDLSKSIDTLGYSALIPGGNRKYLHNQRIGLVSFKDDLLDKLYLNYLLRTHHYQRTIAGSSSGATVHHTSPAKILDYEFALPSLVTQRRIAEILFAYEELIENNRKRIALLEEAAQRLYKEWFVNLRFAGYEAVSIDLETGLPEGWRSVCLADIVSKVTTGLNPRKNFVLGQGSNYYVTIKNMSNNDVYLDEKCDRVDDEAIELINRRSDLQIGDVLFSAVGTIGRVCLVSTPLGNWNVNESIFTLRANELVSKEFLYLLLLSFDLQQYCKSNSHGVAQPGIRMADLKRFELKLPNEATMQEFTALVSPLIDLAQSLKENAKRLQEARDRLLPKLMSGEIEVK